MADNLKGASKKAIYQNKLSQLDNIGSNISDFMQSETLDIVESLCGDFITRVKTNIDNAGMPVTGGIADIKIQTENNQVNVYAPNYILYVDRGVSGTETKYNTPHAYSDKMPPPSVFVEWIKKQNLQLKDNAKYYGRESNFKELTEEQKINNAAWGIAKNIQKHGLKPRNIYSKEIPKLIDDLKNEIVNFNVQAITQFINVKPSAQRTILPDE